MADLPVSIGDVLKGKYRIDRVLGEGGMGYVLAATHVDLRESVAIKFLLPALVGNPDIVERFLREARAALRIKGEHVARVMDIDRLGDGTPFIVMEHLDGNDLSAVRRSGNPLPIAEAVDYVLQACDALAEAHQLGIIHRDIKPANLFVTRRRDGSTCIKVLDFGISKLDGAGQGEASVTKTNAVMGTAEYMSPEQMRSSRDVDARSDLWALGVVLYELCTACPPFPGDTITQVCARVFTEAPTPPRALRPDMPPALEGAILRCLEKDRARRFASVAELVAAMAPFGFAAQRTALQVSTPAARASAAAPEPAPERFSAPTALLPDFAAVAPARSAASGLDVAVAPERLAGSQGPSTTAVVSSDHFPRPPAPRGRAAALGVLGAVAVIVVVALAALASSLRSHSGGDAKLAASPSVEPASVPAIPSAPPAVATVEVQPAAAASTAGPVASTTVSPTKPNVNLGRPGRVSAAPAKSATHTAAAAPGCDPPYVIDANGLKHMKPQCL